MDKSHVSMESRQCVLCDRTYDTGAILLDRRLRNSLEHQTVTGQGVCDTCKQEHTGLPLEQYEHVALIEAIKPVYRTDRRGRHRLVSAETTGRVCFMRKEAYAQVFDLDLGEWEFAMVETEIMDFLNDLQQQAEHGTG